LGSGAGPRLGAALPAHASLMGVCGDGGCDENFCQYNDQD
jgi:hypothetical protein